MLIRHTVCRFLEDRGFHVESATNGVEALEMLDGIQPDLIVTDLQMPRMDGHQLIQKLEARPETSKIPVVVLAGKTATENAPKNHGVQVICKDIDIAVQLGRAVEQLLPGSIKV
jgi:two-component system chemotaxis response regulator CheY